MQPFKILIHFIDQTAGFGCVLLCGGVLDPAPDFAHAVKPIGPAFALDLMAEGTDSLKLCRIQVGGDGTLDNLTRRLPLATVWP